MKVIKGFIAGIIAILMTMAPTTILADSSWGQGTSSASASVHGNTDGSKTVITTPDPKYGHGSKDNTSKNGNSNSRTTQTPGHKTPDTKSLWSDSGSYCDLYCLLQQASTDLAQTGLDLAKQNSGEQDIFWQLNGADVLPGDQVGGSKIVSHTDVTTKTTGTMVLSKEPKYYQWNFEDQSDSSGHLFISHAPVSQSITERFSKPGHWYAYYRVWTKYVTGYKEYRTITVTATVNGKTSTKSATVVIDHPTGTHFGWDPDWTYLIDFYVSADEVGRPIRVPDDVRKTQSLQVDTQQVVADQGTGGMH
jgi:hypothetical protein